MTDRFVCTVQLFKQLRDPVKLHKHLFEKLLTTDLVLHTNSVNKPQV